MTSLFAAARRLAAAGAFAVAAFAASSASAQVTGAGASFPAPLYQTWASSYKAATGTGVNYQSIGSGGGRTQITNRTVDFGASDSPMSDGDLDNGYMFQFPAVIGSVVVVYNLPGVSNLKLTAEIVADIYNGDVKDWNDAKIAAINPGVKLPETAIAPTYRSDASGTTQIFTTWLKKAAPNWKAGASNSVAWGAGSGAKGNEGVAASVKSRPGAVGYVEWASRSGLGVSVLKNAAGSFVTASPASFRAAASQADWANARRFTVDLVNLGGAGTWPIVSPTYIIMPKNPTDKARARAAIDFFDWAFKNGSGAAEKLGYIPVPAVVTQRARAQWKDLVKVNGEAVY